MIFASPKTAALVDIFKWATRHTEDINRFHAPPRRWPTFANDAAAAAGRLPVGDPYVTPDGFMRRRVV
jgi:hypothetical protein